ncbi:MAG TPA: hypothetical protein VMY42_00060 [Thermoguttaceae bacterium]|nr:hypothetical protein [Thermoguttaceae bacterium]
MSRFHSGWILAAIGSTLWCGCSCSRAPDAPDLNPGAAGQEAVAKYDANADDQLDEDELDACPSLLSAFDRIDADKNGLLTASEITDRIKSWQNSDTILMGGGVHILLDGNPLTDATVDFEPEEFLGPGLKPCQGKTGAGGSASLTGSHEEFSGIYLGFYRVSISKKVDGKETVPAKFNTDTELGREVADDVPDAGMILFDLKSK